MTDSTNSQKSPNEDNPFNAKYPVPGQLQYVSAGMEFFLINVFFIGLGWWVDTKLDSLPSFMILGMIIGFAAALNRLIRQVRPYLKARKKLKDQSTHLDNESS